MSDLVGINLNNISPFAADINTGNFLDQLRYTHEFDDFTVETINDQITAHGWGLPTLSLPPPTMQPPSLGDSPGTPDTPDTPATPNSMAGLSTTPTPSDGQHLKSPQQQAKHALDLGSEPQTLRKRKRSKKVKISRANSYPCFIPGCTQRFKRSDFRGTHLRNKHGLPIPKGHWAKVWISKAENLEYYLAAVNLQAYANNLPA